MLSPARLSHAASGSRRFRWCAAFGATLIAAALLGAVPPEAAAKPAANTAAGSQDAQLAEADRLEAEVERLSKQNELEKALGLAEKVYEIRRRHLPDDHPKLALAMSDLGALHALLDHLMKAEVLLKKAVEILRVSHAGKQEHATAVANLGAFYRKLGQRDKGRALAEQALELYEQAAGPRATHVAVAKRVLALQIAGKDYARAEELLKSAIDIHDQAGDKRGSIVARLALANLRKAYAKPRYFELYQEAIKRAKADFGPDEIITGELWRSLAIANRREAFGFTTPKHRKEILAKADGQFAEAVRVLSHNFGPRHSNVAEVYAEWSINAQAQNDYGRAVELRAKANDIEEEQLDAVLAHSVESAKLAYLEKLQAHADDTVSLHLLSYFKRHQGQNAARLALNTVLRRKGRALDSVANTLAILRRRMAPADRKLVDELLQTRAQLSALVIRGPGSMPAADYQRRANELGQRARQIEAELTTKSAGVQRVSPAVTVEAVQAALPKDSALVEIVQVTPRDPKAYSGKARRYSRRYVAYVLRDKGPILFVHLDDAAVIDRVVGQLRAALADPQKQVGDPAFRLFALTLGRFKSLLDETKHLFIAPDGALNLVPFAALADEKGFLVERYSFSYLSSGRDLLRFKAAAEASSRPLVVANPAFDAADAAGAPAGTTRAGDLSRARFPALPGTGEEAAALGRLLPAAEQLTGAKATEAALKQVQGPALLHVATHGFFIANKKKRTRRGSRGLELEDDRPTARPEGKGPPQRRWTITDPLLRSGIALTGANQRRGDAVDDGVLTGLEAAGLDLHGTKLVVLSACETGVGETRPGEGVFGLRRALVIAGSETQVMSLWKVDDLATRDLMTAYYEKLIAGEGRAAALRQVQREMARAGAHRHPFYWAAFIVSGDPSPLELDSREALTDPAKAGGAVRGVEPGPRGCGCRTPGQPSTPEPLRAGWLLALGLVALGRRSQVRRRV